VRTWRLSRGSARRSPCAAGWVVAEEPAHSQPQHHPTAAHRRIGQPALIAAVDPPRRLAARGAGRLGRSWRDPELHTGVGMLDPLDRHARQVR
jgi:hypothetical protein